MDNFNFDKLKSVKTPESWIENAVNIPNRKRKTVPFYFKAYAVGSAAAFVVLTAVLLTLLFHTDGGSPVKPERHAPIVSQTYETTQGAAGENSSQAVSAAAASPTEVVYETTPEGEVTATRYIVTVQASDVSQRKNTTVGSAARSEAGAQTKPASRASGEESQGSAEKPTETAPTRQQSGSTPAQVATQTPTHPAAQQDPTEVAAFTDNTEHTQAATRVNYKSSITVKANEDSPFYDDDSVYISISNDKFETVRRVELQSSVFDYKNGVFAVGEGGTSVPGNDFYVITVYDNDGNKKEITLYLTDGCYIIIKI